MRTGLLATTLLLGSTATAEVTDLGSPHRSDLAALASAMNTWCVDCHAEDDPEAGLDLSRLSTDPESASASVLRRVRDRLQRRDMPPIDDPGPRPDPESYVDLVHVANGELDRRAGTAAAVAPTLRRLNNVEYRNSVFDLTGVDVDADAILPADDVGEGFDSIGSVLSLSPLALEKYLSIAERVAIEAVPLEAPAAARRVEGSDLTVVGGGQARDGGALVWSRGSAEHEFRLPRPGRYRIAFEGWGMQAGPDPVRVAIVAGPAPRRVLAEFDLPETREKPGRRETEAIVESGESAIGVAFINDFVDRSLPAGAQDRNLVVTAIEVEGPLDEVAPTPQVAEMRRTGERREDFARALARRAFRRPADEAAVASLLDAASGLEDESEAQRAMLVRALVDPRFLYRLEAEPAAGAVRPLDGFEVAVRLSYLLWASMPDERLFAAAAAGALDTEHSLLVEVDRMIDSPRSIALSERFGQQWLHISAVETRMPAPEILDLASPLERVMLLEDLKGQTTLFLDAILRENRPVEDLLTAEWTYLNERLARHYGIGGVRGSHLRRVDVGRWRPPGLLGHGSVLLATSNPTRTSPVKRGKWVLESLLDSPPPPPPPDVPTLADRRAAGDRETAREQLARHRSDPNCAGCHVRMDQLGLAFEGFDAVGRRRISDGAAPIDATGRLPDGRVFDGPWELAAVLREDPAFRRSIVKHLMVYALGRGLVGDDEATVDHIARSIDAPSLRDLVKAIVASEQFRHRAGPPAENAS